MLKYEKIETTPPDGEREKLDISAIRSKASFENSEYRWGTRDIEMQRHAELTNEQSEQIDLSNTALKRAAKSNKRHRTENQYYYKRRVFLQRGSGVIYSTYASISCPE